MRSTASLVGTPKRPAARRTCSKGAPPGGADRAIDSIGGRPFDDVSQGHEWAVQGDRYGCCPTASVMMRCSVQSASFEDAGHASFVHDGDAVADVEDLLHVAADHQDRHAFGAPGARSSR